MRLRTVNLSFRAMRALTLLEMMVAVVLLALIMAGLLAMFNQTQKALLAVNTQTDVFQGGRGAVDMVAQDLAEMNSFAETNVTSVYIGTANFIFPSISTTTWLADAFWLTKVNDDWVPFGYFVEPNDTGAGTLYRFTTNTPGARGVRRGEVPALFGMFTNVESSQTGVVQRIAEGVVHFDILATYLETNSIATNVPVTTRGLEFRSNALPAYLDIEVGMLEPTVLKQFQAISSVSSADGMAFLTAHFGKVHFLRERVPIRSFINPYRANEVP